MGGSGSLHPNGAKHGGERTSTVSREPLRLLSATGGRPPGLLPPMSRDGLSHKAQWQPLPTPRDPASAQPTLAVRAAIKTCAC